jgi:hypothetical protein
MLNLNADSLNLRWWWWRQADEDDDAIAAGISTDSVDAEIGFPIVDGPNVAGPIDAHGRLTHHWYEAGRPWWRTVTVQRHAVMQ